MINYDRKIVIVLFVIVAQIFLSCGKTDRCVQEINRLTDIYLPKSIEQLECYDNLEYQFIFEYRIKDSMEIVEFIDKNKLKRYSYEKEKLPPIDNDQFYVVKELESYFSPNKSYPRESSTFYIRRDNYSIVLDQKEGKFIGLVEY